MKRFFHMIFVCMISVVIGFISCEQNQFDKALREYELIVTKWEHKGDNNGNDEFLKMKEEFICIIAEVEYYAKENGISEFQHKRLNQLNKRMYKLVLKEY
ncbi:MAG: hypothetical protein IPI23_13970 [Bacteroidetes bacterium]|nr:hypothetical protein [Bacteroidota bacterium]